MSCQFTWDFNDYKTNENKGEEVDIAVLTSGVDITDVDNNVLDSTFGNLVLDITKTKTGEIDQYQEDYNVIYSTEDSKVLGSLYVVTGYQQPQSDTFQTSLNNISGTVSCKGIFSKFNDGTAIIEYDNESGKRCLTLYERN